VPQLTEKLSKNLKTIGNVMNPLNWGDMIKTGQLAKIQENDEEDENRMTDHLQALGTSQQNNQRDSSVASVR
jgi:hypothetical protein